MGGLTTYGALCAKAKAMYGNRLKASDFRHIASLSSLYDVLDYLRQQPGWGQAVDSLENGGLVPATGQVSRIRLERALRDQTRAEYVRLLNFVPKADKRLTYFPILLTDLQEIMLALRRLQSAQVKKPDPLPPYFVEHSKVDHVALHVCQDFDALIAATRGSIYYAPLLHLRPEEEGALPDYTTTESLLKSTYYAYIYRIIHKSYTGQTKQVLLKSYGMEVDMLNILHILRLKQFFPDEHEYFSVLFPYHYRLKPEMIQALCAAPDLGATIRLLEDTPYGPVFAGMTLRQMEIEYRRRMYAFHKHQLAMGRPSVYLAVAYLDLKDLERQALINVIESVNYGIPFDSTVIDQIGE